MGTLPASTPAKQLSTATANLPEAGSYSGYNPSCSSLQPYVDYTGTATASVGDTTPVVTGISPSDWLSGTTSAVTFSGQSFGTNAPTLSFSPANGISYSLTSYNDTTITANVNVAAGTSNETVSVTVTSNGYNGQGFSNGGNGQSANSQPATAAVHQSMNYTEITVIGWVDANAITLPSAADSQIQSDLNNPYTCAFDVVQWFYGNPYHLASAADNAYASGFLLQKSGNLAPPTTTLGPTPSAWIANNKNNYRLANDYGGKAGAFQVGITPDPCGTNLPGPIANWVAAGEASIYNGATGTSPSGQAYQLAEGRLGSFGQAVNQTLNGHTSPFIFSTH